MWKIFEHKKSIKQINSLPTEILKRYEKWKDIVSISGPNGLKQIKGFNDEPLVGEWNDHRSSRLNLQYRVIYKIENEQFFVQVVKVTAHDYRRNNMKDYQESPIREKVSIGESVRIIRELQELSQNALSTLTGIPQSTLSAIEHDKVNLGVERAKVLARALHVHPAVLVFPGWNIEQKEAA